MTVLNDLKELLEMDSDEDIFDSQLLQHANSGINYLKNNAIPITKIDLDTEPWDAVKDDYQTVLSWLNLFVLQRFDRSLMNGPAATKQWIESDMEDSLYQLKIKYDRGQS
ncbi:hypothetical protein H9L19_06815 [Weissella diestrammenae]|uniref:Phage gp6-like head-tail connector protein n=2 Tax=Weissella diestrammenae TaxID=1162633 RepID=A0A7G9T7P7_9LACO|nr:hypothetical protein [Weissella diestrammenae]QNN76122.1 hypothetical protein H9L19_06815 [Weissella diestrammenae]